MSRTEVVDMEVSKEKRSMRTLPPPYGLSLVFTHRKKYRYQTFCSLSDERCRVKSIPEMRGMWYVTSSYGWLLMKGYYSPNFYLFNPDTLTKIHLPPLSNYCISGAVLTSSPTDPNCVVMLFSRRKQSIIFCRICHKKWVEQSLIPYNKDPISIDGEISAISCEGKIYLIFLKGLAIIHEFYDKFAEIELHDLKYSYGSPFTGAFMCCIVKYLESCGEIFRVSGIMYGMSDLIQTFDVFKLDFSTLAWIKVESIGDRIFLLSQKCSMSVSATEVGLKGNCIYFAQPRYTSLYRYDMYEGTITVTLPYPKKFPFWDGPFWVVRNCKLQLQVMSTRANVKNGNGKGTQDGSWDGLPTELLPLIMSSLFLGDCIRFRLTCKSWSPITPPLRLNYLPMHPESGSQFPWLISFPNNDIGVCNFYHPIFGDAYTMNIPELAGAVLCNARYGWLLMSRGSTCIFLINPFTREIVNLPDLEENTQFESIFFSSPPTSSDFVVYGLEVMQMLVYRKGENTWCTYSLCSQPTFKICTFPCNPVFYGGIFYFLRTDGRLAIFNPNAIGEESQWEVFPKSAVFCMSKDTIFETSIRNFIVECDGEILSVFVGVLGKPIWIFKLDHMKMKWDRLENLGDKVIFLSGNASTMIPAGAKGIENRIYFPRLHGQRNLFYSLSTCNYHSVGSKDSRGDWLNTTEHWHCAWIHPTK